MKNLLTIEETREHIAKIEAHIAKQEAQGIDASHYVDRLVFWRSRLAEKLWSASNAR
jgi:hypothetical protein